METNKQTNKKRKEGRQRDKEIGMKQVRKEGSQTGRQLGI